MTPTRSGFAVSLILVAACAGPSPTTRPTGQSATSPSSDVPTTPEPRPAVATIAPVRSTREPIGTPEQESLPASASVEQHGIRLTIRVSPNPLEAGHRAVGWVTIQNVGRRELRWMNDGCDTNAGIIGSVDAIWRESERDVRPELRRYRDWLREEANLAWPISLSFRRGMGAPRRNSGCADLGLPKKLRSGGKVTQEFLWDGFAAPRLGKPPSGPATLSATFDAWSRPGSGPEGAPITVDLESWILRGRPDEYLSPAEAIDAALSDERLASWLITRPLRSGADAIAEFDTDLGMWAVGLLMYRDDEDPVLHAAFLDPVTGEVISVREHPAPFS